MSSFQEIVDSNWSEKEQQDWHHAAKRAFYVQAVAQQREARWRKLNDYLRKQNEADGHA